MAVISIIVPIYNTEKYVKKCLDSLCCQTLADIEIICVDDASTDDSLSIAATRAASDERIHIIRHPKNQGTSQARKHGVEAASGDYIMFVDSDDWLESQACEKLYERIRLEQVDILQFGTNIIPAVPLQEEMIQWIENFLKPYEQRVEGKDILRLCFVEDKFDFNITDKLWVGKICKKAFARIGDQRMVAAEDRYAFFLLAYFADSYLGISDAAYYNYNVGIGITGGDQLDLERFEKRCTGAMAVQAVWRFLEEQGETEKYQEEFRLFKDKILWDCVYCWYYKLDSSDHGMGYDHLLTYWEPDQITSAIARTFFEQEDNILLMTNDSEKMNHYKNIGIYYRFKESESMLNDIKNNAKCVLGKGQEIILFTDSDTNSELASKWNMKTVLLSPSKDANWDQYERRSYDLYNKLKENEIGCMFYASPSSHIAWLDILLMKSAGIRVICLEGLTANEMYEKRNDEFLPKVSIVIPVYNGSNYLKEAIDSALSQDYPNLEVIVVNDGTDDGQATENIALSYGNQIRYFYKENGGVASALNYGIRKMTGEYFSWLSHDDKYRKNKISSEIKALSELEDKKRVVCCGYHVIDRNGEFQYEINPLKEYGKERLEIPLFPVFQCCINGCALLIHKSHFERVGMFNENLPTTQDYDLWFRILRGQKICFIGGPLFYSRNHEEQDSRKRYGEHIEECNALWIRLFRELTMEEKCQMGGGSELAFLKCEKDRFLKTDYYEVVEYLHKELIKVIKNGWEAGTINAESFVKEIESLFEDIYEVSGNRQRMSAEAYSILLSKYDKANKEKYDFETRYNAILNSTCWNLTKPIRDFMNLLKQNGNK